MGPFLLIAPKPLVVIVGLRIAPCIAVADTLPQSFVIVLQVRLKSHEHFQKAESLGIMIGLVVCPSMVESVFP